MTKTSWVEICVSDFEQSIQWFENVLGDSSWYATQTATSYVPLRRFFPKPSTYRRQIADAYQREASRIIE